MIAAARLLPLALALILAGCATAPPASETSAALDAPAPAPEAAAPARPVTTLATATPAPALELLEDSMNPGERVDPAAAEAQADLWARMRRGFALDDLDDDWVRKAEAWYSARPDYVERMTTRGSRYLFHVLQEVEKRGMPSELALLPFVESAFVTHAESRAKAAGMWQFMPATGRDFDLKQNVFRDDRRDVLASTRAALDFLGRLHAKFGDWHLALAAYNWGPGNVAKAIARNEKLGRPTDYASLKMPDETRYYVPKLQAVKNIVLDPARYALALPAVANHPYFLSVKIDRDMDVATAAGLAEMSLDDFRSFNPQATKPVLLAAATPQLLLPYDQASTFVTNLARHEGPLSSWTAWVVPKTMNPAEAAKRVGMNEAELRDINRIPPRMLVKGGSTLLVPRGAHVTDDVAERVADAAALNLAPDAPPLRKVSFKAGKTDSVTAIAARYKLKPEQVAGWNKVAANARFKPGQLVVVYTPNKPAATPVKPTAKVAKDRARRDVNT